MSLSAHCVAQEVSRLGPTMYFGELALLRNEPRAASVKVPPGTRPPLLKLAAAELISCTKRASSAPAGCHM